MFSFFSFHKYQSDLHGLRVAPLQDDEFIIPETQEALLTAEKNCEGGSCTLPETQHLQIRVGIFLLYQIVKCLRWTLKH